MDAIDNLLTDEIAVSGAAQLSGALQLSRAKSRVARRLRAARASAMLEAADVASAPMPAWMLSARPLVAAWIGWTSCLHAIIAAARANNDQPLSSGRVEVHRAVGAHATSLCGGIYMGTLTGVLALSERPVCQYMDEPAPKIVIAQSALPETVVVSIDGPRDHSNRGRRLSDVIDHPFVTAYDPPITTLANVDGAVEMAMEPGYVTLAPVPVSAMRVVPPDADLGRPWELTPRELEAIRVWMPPVAVRGR
ncbi:hypothetical protein [Sphingomonas radiodurans]|uniref:hypothetical protein n=1 Tax=Sphingomonas radiodurans TaxID=2890321 RepID=UPI001E540599|nr:hypothetical protein [Sphingomonas radiodurans]WBH15824.1 hypothetical protein LLW23_13555 [Sphingomonas radiodurans]